MLLYLKAPIRYRIIHQPLNNATSANMKAFIDGYWFSHLCMYNVHTSKQIINTDNIFIYTPCGIMFNDAPRHERISVVLVGVASNEQPHGGNR